MHASTLPMQVCQPDGEVIITNDGATILNKMTVQQPAAKMLVELSKSQVLQQSRKNAPDRSHKLAPLRLAHATSHASSGPIAHPPSAACRETVCMLFDRTSWPATARPAWWCCAARC